MIKETAQLQEAASAITSALCSTLTLSKASQPSSHSPARVIGSRSKLYKQLTELQNLKNAGVLDDAYVEYKTEKETIMNLLKHLSTNE